MNHLIILQRVNLLAIVSLLGVTGCEKKDSVESEKEIERTLAPHIHATTEETCFICNASKRESGRLWCAEHSRYEDRCWLCQPQLEDKKRAYCKEHFLYEDECFLCHPELKKGNESEGPSKKENTTEESPIALHDGLFCKEHNVPELECGICQPQLARTLEAGRELKVRFESNLSAEKAGIQTIIAREIQSQASVHAICEVSYNENKFARITPLASGIIKRVLEDLGTTVMAGDALVEIHSSEIAKAKATYVAAFVDAELKDIACRREADLAEKKISSERDFQEAEAAYKTAKLAENTARQVLQNYGFTDTEIEVIKTTQDTSALFFARAPYNGTLVEREAVVGEATRPGDYLFTLADLSTMWLSLSIPADRAVLVKSGLQIKASFPSENAINTIGELTWISPSIDEKSRMLKGRAVVNNSYRQLRSGMYGDAQILLSSEHRALGVPKDAIQRYEKKPFVFVKLEDDLFSLRRVVVESSSDNFVAIVSGLQQHEPVVVDGAYTVMSEFLKSRLGAGCVDD